MVSVKGVYRNGVAHPDEPVEGHDGQPVLITFLKEEQASAASDGDDAAGDVIFQLIEKYAVETEIPDLADQHDHYLYGKPKHE